MKVCHNIFEHFKLNFNQLFVQEILKGKDFSSFNSLDKKLIDRATNLMEGFDMEMTISYAEVQSMS